VVTIRFSKSCKASAIGIDAVIVKKVRVLSGVSSARAEPGLAGFLVDVVHAANGPVSFCDLVDHLASSDIITIEVFPTVALRSPDKFPLVVNIAGKGFAAVIQHRA
jgi:hypothetical protein